jgi:putative ABC transport system substrate-binding protein
MRPEAIIAVSSHAIRAASNAAPRTPIVMGFAGEDPVVAGLATSLARPGGMITGVAFLAADREAKRAELLAQAIPHAGKLGLLFWRYGEEERIAPIRATAGALGRELVVVRASYRADYDEALTSLARAGVGAIVVGSSPVFSRDGDEIARLATSMRLGTICEWREMAKAGCLISYGPDSTSLYRKVGTYVARILQGERPGDLPIEQPATFELILNLTTAKALGISLPGAFVARADEVIE